MNIIRGDWVSTGQRVVVLSPVTQAHKQQQLPLSALVYVPLNKGKQLSVGMPVLLEVSSVIKGGFGKVKATVVSVSDLAVSSDTLSLRLNNPELEKQILAAGAPFELLVDLEPDATEVSGYRWTSTPGPKVHLSPGTYVDASVTEQSRTIMSLVIPALRQLFQLDES